MGSMGSLPCLLCLVVVPFSFPLPLDPVHTSASVRSFSGLLIYRFLVSGLRRGLLPTPAPAESTRLRSHQSNSWASSSSTSFSSSSVFAQVPCACSSPSPRTPTPKPMSASASASFIDPAYTRPAPASRMLTLFS
ncbi:hypothetical protein B0H67DRAFT_208972 [Lasiosphaeris hirsuta]|uniref:Secreted protein n=1 Tax=Lasiosphaeris hirsuta TaxID=260670 RepID=A0AA40E1N1_9PEZI|nr:hypothetical protein B0H67DRAFT_208972 [Lasiosphaeris hirsuta]